MIDLQLLNGDISFEKIDRDTYDLSINEDSFVSLVQRAIQTPLGYISKLTIKDNNIISIDSSFGDAIYNRLSEGLTINLISQIRQDVINAITTIQSESSFNSNTTELININEVVVEVPSLDSVNIKIYFPNLSTPISSTIRI